MVSISSRWRDEGAIFAMRPEAQDAVDRIKRDGLPAPLVFYVVDVESAP